MEPNEEIRFKNNFKVLFKRIKDIASQDEEIKKKLPAIILQVIDSTIDAYDNKLFIDSFIRNSYLYWDKILEKDENFFIENSTIVFKHLPSDKVQAIAELFKSDNKKLNKKFREDLWKIMESFVKISIKYLHKKSIPVKTKLGESYQKPLFPEIDIRNEASKWKIDLVFPEYF
jgi:hypothetical protein